MTTDNDIVERLRALSRCEHSDLSVGDEAAAEIVRLRGEVEGMRHEAVEAPAEAFDPSIHPIPGEGQQPASVDWAMVEALEMPDGYEVQEFLPGGWHYAWTRSDGEQMVSGTTWNHPALAAIAAWQAVYDRAADNRGAAGVEWDAQAYAQMRDTVEEWKRRALEAENERLRKDAERYLWLRKGESDDVAVVRGLGAMDYGMGAVVYTYSKEINGDDLDAAIDAARRGEGGAE